MHSMETLLNLEKLIEQAKAKGIDFGKGDPYNRLRYYTKIGWLPHMTRKKAGSASASGHYPLWALDRLILIEKLKVRGTTNEEITQKINTEIKLHNLKNLITSPEIRLRAVTYVSFIILVIILLNELDILKLGKSKREILDKTAQSATNGAPADYESE